jgi:SAM-dependent methyltransferase
VEGRRRVTPGESYIIRGGIEGRERLRLLARVMRPTTLALFDRLNIAGDMRCLDVGCGGGDVTIDLASRVAPAGSAVGVDIDHVKLELARAEAIEGNVGNVEFRQADAATRVFDAEFDAVYTRFLLTHLPDPAGALRNFVNAARPGGVIIIEDIDFDGAFCYPPHPAFDRYVELYTTSVRKHGGDPCIGPRLPGMLFDAGCEDIAMNVVQPAGLSGDAKLITPITVENISDAVAGEGLATSEEIAQVTEQLYALAHDERTVMSTPRIVQAWGRRPA